MPNYLELNTENETLTSGANLTISCKEEDLFLHPDTDETNQINLDCGENGQFVQMPETWPICVVKCQAEEISAEFGFEPLSK